MVQKFITKRLILKVALALLLLAFSPFLYKTYMHRITAFGCFDDCFNFMGGYFLLHGKKLFSEIFFNHAPLMAYISAGIQAMTQPINVYDLVLKHRQFIFFFGLVADILLVLRFGFPAFGFAVFYEWTKFYVFGDRFLAEGIIIYPLLYLFGLVWERVKPSSVILVNSAKQNASRILVDSGQARMTNLLELILAAIATWFIVFMREPYILLVSFLFLLILRRQNRKNVLWALGIFILLTFITITHHSASEMLFNIVTINFFGVGSYETVQKGIIGKGIFEVFFYPLYLFWGGEWGFFRAILLYLNVTFLLFLGYALMKRQFKKVLFIIVSLGLANFRFEPPGREFFEAFHMIIWYGLFLFSIFVLAKEYFLKHTISAVVIMLIPLFALGTVFFSHGSFLYDRIDPQAELLTNYGPQMQVGEVIKTLSKPTDTLFLDGADDIIYWQAHRYSSYQYSWYTSLMHEFPKYTKARIAMFEENPPDFYYGSCPSLTGQNRILPDSVKPLYTRLSTTGGQLSCLWVKTTKLANVSQEQWEKAATNFYRLPLPTDQEQK